MEDNIAVPEPWESHRKSCAAKRELTLQAMESHPTVTCPQCEAPLRMVMG
jgi:predicted nucleic acid-binding Zn ribbon protein